MDIKSKSITELRLGAFSPFIICVVFFIATLMTGAMALESASFISGTGMDVDDVLFFRATKRARDFKGTLKESRRHIVFDRRSEGGGLYKERQNSEAVAVG
ncbi:MAG: hypothetical protein ACOX4J_05940 [Anaerovoracaceae bacterium]